MWSEKYRPQNISDMVGNEEPREAIIKWFAKWKKGTKPLLIIGPPGIGKTTIAYLLAKQFGYDMIGLNASDVRSKSRINEILNPVLGNVSVLGTPMIFVDEVDGIHGRGDYGGISWPGRAIKVIKAGAPIDMIIPEEGIGWEMQVVAIMEGTDNLEDAKTLMDWTLGDGMKLFGERQSIIADSSKVTKDPELPDFYDEVQAKLINNDFVWAAANKDRIVAEWKKRYDGKTEPKS